MAFCSSLGQICAIPNESGGWDDRRRQIRVGMSQKRTEKQTKDDISHTRGETHNADYELLRRKHAVPLAMIDTGQESACGV